MGRATVNLKILLDTRVRQSIRKYSWTPACDSQLENSPGPPRATVNLKIVLDNRLDSQYENTPRHPCDSHFPKDISALSWSFLLENWNKTNVYEMITHYTSCQQCQTVSNSVNSVNSVDSVNSYSAVLPPSPMVFLRMLGSALVDEEE